MQISVQKIAFFSGTPLRCRCEILLPATIYIAWKKKTLILYNIHIVKLIKWHLMSF